MSTVIQIRITVLQQDCVVFSRSDFYIHGPLPKFRIAKSNNQQRSRAQEIWYLFFWQGKVYPVGIRQQTYDRKNHRFRICKVSASYDRMGSWNPLYLGNHIWRKRTVDPSNSGMFDPSIEAFKNDLRNTFYKTLFYSSHVLIRGANLIWTRVTHTAVHFVYIYRSDSNSNYTCMTMNRIIQKESS